MCLDTDWEKRQDSAGNTLYYDHDRQEVRLDHPTSADTDTTASPQLKNFLARSRMNLLLRQPSLPSQADEGAESEPESPTHTASKEVVVELTPVAMEGAESGCVEGVESSPVEGMESSGVRNGVESPTEGMTVERSESNVERSESKVEGVETGGGTVGHVMLSRLDSVSDKVRRSPGFQFLTRADLYKFAKVRKVGGAGRSGFSL